MQPAFENLLTPPGQSFRCFNRESLSITTRWHRHPELELTYVERGSGTRIVGDNIASYADHDLVLVGANLPHTWQSDDFRGHKHDRHPAIVIQFRQEFLGTEFFAIPEFSAIRGMFESASRGLFFPPATASRIGRLLNRLVAEPPARRLVRLLECLVELADCTGVEQLASVTFSIKPESILESRTKRICAYIAEHYRDPNLTQQALAAQAEMNSSAFSRFFRESTGKTVTDYLSEMRVSLACRMLIHTNIPVTEVYQHAGFGNASSFNRQFRQLKRMSAREFRRLYREVAIAPAKIQSLPLS